MNVSVVIVNYKTRELLARCLRSLAIEAPSARDIIVIDNASGDGSVEMLRKDFPHVRRIASHTNVGFGHAVNWGLTNAREDTILVLNPDVEVQPGSLRTLVAELARHPDVGLIAPKLVFPDGSLQYSCMRWQTPVDIAARRTVFGKTPVGRRRLDHFEMHDYDHSVARDVDWVIGGCMLVRRRAIDEVGGMDEQFFMYCEDLDWCRRFWQAGWRVRYEPQAVMTHHYRRQSARLHGVLGVINPLARVHISSGIKYFYKHLGSSRKLSHAQVAFARR